MPRISMKLVGLNSDLPAKEIGNAWSGIFNMRMGRGFAERVRGDETYLTLVPNDFPQHLLNSFDVLQNVWLVGAPDGIYGNDGNGWKTLTPAGWTAVTTPGAWTGCRLNGIPVMNQVDNSIGHYWDKDFSTPSLFQALPNSPNVQAMRSYKNFLIGMDSSQDGGGGTNWPDTEESVIWSAEAPVGTIPATWIPAATNLAGAFQLGDTNGPVVDGIQVRDAFVIGKSDALYVMQYVPDSNIVMAQRKLFGSTGLLARNCMAEFEGVCYFMGSNDIYATDGTAMRSVADNLIRRTIFDNLAEDPRGSWLAINPQQRELWVAPLLESAEAYPNVIYTMDLDTGHWGHRVAYKADDSGLLTQLTEIAHAASGVGSETIVDLWSTEAVLEWDSESVKTWDSGRATGQDKVMIMAMPEANATPDGLLYRADTALDQRGSGVQRDGIIINDDEDAIYTVRRVWLDTEQTADLSVRVGSRYDDSSVYSYAPSFAYSPTDRNVPQMVKGRDFSVLVTGASEDAWSVQRISLEFAETRGRF